MDIIVYLYELKNMLFNMQRYIIHHYLENEKINFTGFSSLMNLFNLRIKNNRFKVKAVIFGLPKQYL
jgi:hypothetical protein